MKNKTIISTFALFVVLTIVGLFSSNPYIAFGSIFFAGGFFFVGIGLATEKKEDKEYVKGFDEEHTIGFKSPAKEPSFRSKIGKESKRINDIVNIKAFDTTTKKNIKLAFKKK